MASTTPQASGTPKIETSKPPAVEPQLQPPANSPDLVLVPATPTEGVQADLLNNEEWKGPLTLEQYLRREAILQSVDLTKDGRITGWILTSTSLPANEDGTRPIFASCETYPKHGYVAKDGKVDKVQAHGIGSVFTRPEYRGKGYAGRMMADLGKRLETWQQVDGQINPFSVLYSDIGRNFYAKHGWKAYPSTHIHFAPLPPAEYEAARGSLPAVEDLSAAELKQIPTIDYLEQRLQQLSGSRTGTVHVAVRPDSEHFQWHFAREEYYHEVLGKAEPKIKGAIHRDTGLGLVWLRKYAADPKEWRLYILHTVLPPSVENSPDTQAVMAALLARAQREAHEWDLPVGVEVWNPSDLVIAAAKKLKREEHEEVKIVTRDMDHICSLRWAAGGNEEVVWVANEQYAWC
ncbi:hypothetical protein KCU88_g7120, partial [Aureobasidium melanogenum]